MTSSEACVPRRFVESSFVVSDQSVFRRKGCFSLRCPCKRTFCTRQNYCYIPGGVVFVHFVVSEILVNRFGVPVAFLRVRFE